MSPTITPHPDFIRTRTWPTAQAEQLQAAGLSPVLARIYAARGITQIEQLQYRLQDLPRPELMLNLMPMAERLYQLIQAQRRFLVLGDFDADGATATAVMVWGLRQFGAHVRYLVPDRQKHGYGLSPALVQDAIAAQPDVLITVDQGISSLDGVAAAQALGWEVLITDHHLPGPHLPPALIVNPNQPGCNFPCKALAGVGVAFYVITALRQQIRLHQPERGSVSLAPLLEWVALGTVADVVALDHCNRTLVHHGLQRLHQGRASPGLQALFEVAGRDLHRACSQDLAFSIGPRINAAGRLENMQTGIACLLAENLASARTLAQELHQINQARKEVEMVQREEAQTMVADLAFPLPDVLCLYHAQWHQGLIGLLAGRIKDQHQRTTIALAPVGSGLVKGSGRSVPGIHLRDLLAYVDGQHPGLLKSFGGHAMAAGLSLAEERWPELGPALNAALQAMYGRAPEPGAPWSDGELPATERSLAMEASLRQQVWGQAFAAPAFHGTFKVSEQRRLGEKHWKLKLHDRQHPQAPAQSAVLFNHEPALPDLIHALYRLQPAWRGDSVELLIEHWQEAEAAK